MALSERTASLTAILISGAVVLAVDLLVPLGVATGVAYVVPLLFALKSQSRISVYLTAGAASGLIVLGGLLSASGGVPSMVLANRLLSIAVLWTTAYLGNRMQDRAAEVLSIVKTAAEAIISVNRHGRVLSFNRAAEKMFGAPARTVVGRNLSALVPLTFPPEHQAGFAEEIQDVSARRFDGEVFPATVAVSEVMHARQHRFTVIVRDLSRDKRRESDLRKLWRAIEQIPASVMITDASGDIEYVNARFTSVTGFRSAEVVGKNPRVLKSDHNPADAYQQMWATITRGGIWRGILVNRKKSGELFEESVTICPVSDDAGVITHYLALAQDITEERERARRLERAVRLESVGQLTGGIAHDFKNLLTIILGNLQFIEEGLEPGPHDLAEPVADALSAARDGEELIERLLQFSRVHDSSPTLMDVAILLDDLGRLLHRTIPANIQLHLEAADLDAAVLVDRQQFHGAILNLVTNACDAIPGKGHITISAASVKVAGSRAVDGLPDLVPGEYVRIAVDDTGVGMTAALLQKVMQPYFSTKEPGKGTGLGLFTAWEFATSAGGDLHITSSPGVGTTAEIFLPTQELAYPSEDLAPVPDYLPRGSETVLVVEDSDKVRRFASRALRRLGYRVLQASDAQQALDSLAAAPGIALLFTDIVLPGDLDGRQLAAKITQCAPGTKVLLTTGVDSSRSPDTTPDPSYPLLPKPYSIGAIAQSIRSVLDTGGLPG